MKNLFSVFVFFAGAAAVVFAGTRPANHTVFEAIPPLTKMVPVESKVLKIVPAARHSRELVNENSGLAPCSLGKEWFWTINDSGGLPKIYVIDSSGNVHGNGVTLTKRRNIDWECITRDPAGNLIVGDVGNNRSNRRNLVFYIVPEPKDLKIPFTEESRKISFYFSSQDDFVPASGKNFDCESCFAVDSDFIYFFTKHWGDTESVLWRVSTKTEDYQPAFPLVRFNAGGMVTDAAVSPGQKKLAVLMYHGLWIFEIDSAKESPRERFFNNPRFFKILPSLWRDWQTEGVAFVDENTLVISSESGALFRVNL